MTKIRAKSIFIFLIIGVILISLMAFSSCFLLKKDTEQQPIHFYNYVVEDKDITFDGSEKKVTISVYDLDNKKIETINPDVEHPDFDIEYEDNIDAGTAKVTIIAKDGSKKYKGQAVVNFVILKADRIEAINAAELKEYTECGNYKNIDITSDIVIDETFRIPEGVSVNLNGYTLEVSSYLSIKGVLDLSKSSTLYITGSVGNLNNNPFITEDDGQIYLNKKTYTDIDLNINKLYKDKISVYQRQSLYIYKSQATYPYADGEEIKPTFTTNFGTSEDFDVTYENNKNVGNAKIIVKSKINSKYVYGDSEVEFTITPVMRYVSSITELNTIMEDKNNTLITIKGNLPGETIDFPGFEIKEGFEIHLERVNVNGNLVVNGKLVANNLTIDGDLNVAGEFEAEVGVVNIDGECVVDGKFTNAGTLNAHSTFIVNNVFTNTNTATFSDDVKITQGAACENNGTVFFDADLDNEGRISNIDKMFILGTFETTSNISNTANGKVVSDVDYSAYVSNYDYKARYILRVPITIDKANLKYTESYYNNQSKSVDFSFDSVNSLTVAKSEYDYTTQYQGQSAPTNYLKNPGVVDCTISFKKDSLTYNGSVTLQYTILRGIYEITENSSDSDLAKALLDINYGTYQIKGTSSYKTVTFSSSVQIPQSVVLTIENAKVIFNSSVTIDGEMRVNTNATVLVNNTFTVNGKTNTSEYNDGEVNNLNYLIFKGKNGDQITLNNNGTINNMGHVLFDDIAQDNVILGEGDVSTRVEINSAHILNLAAQVELNTVSSLGVRPTFDLVIDGETIEMQNNYSALYSNNTSAGSTASLVVQANEQSTKIYGSASKAFSVIKGDVYVTGENVYTSSGAKKDFQVALDKCTNFNKIIFANNITYTARPTTMNTDNVKITIPAGAVVDCGEYAFTFVLNEYRNTKPGSFEIINNGTLIMRKGISGSYNLENYNGLMNSYDIKGKLSLNGTGNYIGEAYSAKDLADLVPFCKQINVMENLARDGGSYFEMQSYFFNVTIDLNGYTVDHSYKVDSYRKNIVIESTGSKGTIGSSAFGYSIWLTRAQKDYGTLTLRNINYKGQTRNDASSYLYIDSSCTRI